MTVTAKKTRIISAAILGGAILVVSIGTFALYRGNAVWLFELLLASDTVCEVPEAFGSFHLSWLSVCIFVSVILGIWSYRKGNQLTDPAVFVAGLFLLFLEFYKQTYSFFILNGGQYDFSILPFQFCSLPLYLYLAAPLLSEGRVKDALYKFLALFCTMGGALVMGYPAFYERASLCWHTMLWHTVMIAVGVLILFSRGYGKRWGREVLPASFVFLISVTIATLLNVALTPFAATSPAPLNLFYMSPYEKTYFWVVRDVQAAFGWLPSLLCYVLLFIFVGATVVFGAAFWIRLLANQHAMPKNQAEKNQKV